MPMQKKYKPTLQQKRDRQIKRIVREANTQLTRLLLNANGRTCDLAQAAFELGLRHGKRLVKYHG